MPLNLQGRSFLTLKDFTQDEIRYLLDLAHDLKRRKREGVRGELLCRKNIVLLFEKTSTRTRCAFETAILDEGGHATFLSGQDSQMNIKESIEDTAKVLGRYYDGIEYRGSRQSTVEELAQHAGVPVWNGLTDADHPTQVLADLMTVEEQVFKPLRDVKFVYVGDARNNMGNALLIGCAKMGMDYTAIAPKELWTDETLVVEMQEVAEAAGGRIHMTEDLNDVKGADVIYTDVWVSMGEEALFKERIQLLTPYRVDRALMDKTENSACVFMHCLPSFHDSKTTTGREISEKYGIQEMEVSDEVFRSRQSRVFDQAENRLHTIKAVMVATIGKL